jgi:hypothetical protein
MEVGLEINVENINCMLLSCHQNVGQNRDSSFQNVSQFKQFGTSVTKQILIQEEIKRRQNCYNSVQNILSSRLLSKNVKIRIYNIIFLPVVLHGCETWSLTL